MSDKPTVGFVAFNPVESCSATIDPIDWSKIELPAVVKAERDRLRAENEAVRADLAWLGGYLSANYPIGRSDGWRICIGGACGATWEEAVRAGRELHERMRAEYLARQAAKDAEAR